jgi:single-strand DNA-binding protein
MYQNVVLLGRLAADPNLRETKAGKSVASLRVVTNSRQKKDDEWVDVPEFHNVVVFGAQAEWEMSKGDVVFVQGELKTRKWEDKEGVTRYNTEIVCHNLKTLGSAGRTARKPKSDDDDDTWEKPAKKGKPREADLDDSIPF